MSDIYVHGYSAEEQERLRRMNTVLNDRCLSKINLDGMERILDLGSGLGIFSRDMARLSKAKVTALEFEERQISLAQKLAERDRETNLVNYVQGSVYDLEKHYSGEFDLIFTRFLLEHLGDVQGAVKQCFAALRQGGRLIIMDDDHANFRIMPEPSTFQHLWSSYCQVFKNEGQDPFVGRRLVSVLHAAGFVNIELDFVRFGAAKEQEHFDLYADNLMGIVAGAKQGILNLLDWTEDSYDKAITELYEWKQMEDAALWYPANWAEGLRIDT